MKENFMRNFANAEYIFSSHLIFFSITMSILLPLWEYRVDATVVAESHNQSADTGQSELTDFSKNHAVYDTHRFFFFTSDPDSI